MLKVAEIEEAEKDKMRQKCKKIIDHGTHSTVRLVWSVCAGSLCAYFCVLP